MFKYVNKVLLPPYKFSLPLCCHFFLQDICSNGFEVSCLCIFFSRGQNGGRLHLLRDEMINKSRCDLCFSQIIQRSLSRKLLFDIVQETIRRLVKVNTQCGIFPLKLSLGILRLKAELEAKISTPVRREWRSTGIRQTHFILGFQQPYLKKVL